MKIIIAQVDLPFDHSADPAPLFPLPPTASHTFRTAHWADTEGETAGSQSTYNKKFTCYPQIAHVIPKVFFQRI